MPNAPDFPLTPDGINLLCACARKGLALLADQADAKLMAQGWDCIRLIGEYGQVMADGAAEAKKKNGPPENDPSDG